MSAPATPRSPPRSRRAQGVAALNVRRGGDGLPVTDMYLGLHVGEVFYGNVGSTERLDFTVVGPAVNEASRIAAMCRSVEQPMLVSAAFAEVGTIRRGWCRSAATRCAGSAGRRSCSRWIRRRQPESSHAGSQISDCGRRQIAAGGNVLG